METRTFKYDPNRFAELRKITLTRSIPMIIIALAAGLYISLRNSQSQNNAVDIMPIAIPLSILLSLIAGSVGLMRADKRQKRLYESYRLTIDESGISREQLDTPPVRIMKGNITLIAKNKNGSFTIKGKNSREVIGIAAQVESYDELERILRQTRPFEVSDQKPLLEKYGKFFGIVTIILYGAVFLSEDITLVTLCGAVLLGLMGWSFTAVQRNKNIDIKTKRHMYIAIFSIFPILAKLVFVWL